MARHPQQPRRRKPEAALARVRLQAHRSARTYQEQLAEVMAARVEMRRIGAVDIVNSDASLTGWIIAMKEYLDALGHEFAAGYLHAARSSVSMRYGWMRR